MEALTPYNTQHKITFQFSVQKIAPPYFLDPNKLKHLMCKIKTVFSPLYLSLFHSLLTHTHKLKIHTLCIHPPFCIESPTHQSYN